MRCVNRLFLVGGFALLVGVLGRSAAASATFHLALDKSSPSEGAALTEVPSEIRLWFTQEPQAAGTAIRLMASDSTLVPVGDVAVDAGDAKVFSVAVDDLADGSYSVIWRAMAADGHVVRGEFGFTLSVE